MVNSILLQTMYGRMQFISMLITKAREKVQGFYHLMGTPDKVRDNVKWLLTQSRFMYDDINLEICMRIHSNISLISFHRNEPTTKQSLLALISLSTLLKVYGSQQIQDPI